VEKYGTTGQLLRLACWISKVADTHRMSNTYYFFTATVVARTRLVFCLCVHCLSCFTPTYRIAWFWRWRHYTSLGRR